ncbi:MAG: DmsC/YnfH family molybdoenzyme membrane anchor subunit [Rhodospirillaceae bacterium]
MHPAYSVIFFTTASGAGYGMLALMAILGVSGVLPADRWLGFVGLALALGLITGGLLSSTFHLGRPERAWRAVSQWRSSWLAREGVMAILTYIPAGLFGIGWVFLGQTTGFWGVMGVLAAVGAFLTIVCTSMIYRSLKTIHQWHNDWTIAVYVALGVASGAVVLSFVAHLFGVAETVVKALPVVLLPIAWVIKAGYWAFIDRTRSLSTSNTATGLRGSPVRSVDWPHTQENYLQKEMGFQVARKHALKLRALAHLLIFAVPLGLAVLTLVVPNPLAGLAAFVAVTAMAAGLLAERWLFFAEAKHTVTLFYGAQAA